MSDRLVKIQLKPKLNSPAALPHLQERLVHSLKSIRRNLDRINFLASCKVDHRLTTESGGNTNTGRSASNPRNHLYNNKNTSVATQAQDDKRIYPMVQFATKACLSPRC
jgi:hypothetical protein